MADQLNIDQNTFQMFEQARKSPLYFAESLLIDPFQDAPFQATFPQRVIFSSKKKTTFFASHRRSGKMAPLTSKVFTPEGFKKMGDLVIGDLVLTPDGKSAKITALHPFPNEDVFRIHFSDKTYVEAGAGHLWEVYTPTNWKSIPGVKGSHRQQYGFKILTTLELMGGLTYKYSNRSEFQFKVRGIQPATHLTKDLPIDPYLLGAFLGDGCLTQRIITSADPAVIETIETRIKEKAIPRKLRINSNCRDYFFSSPKLKTDLITLGLIDKKSKTKFIPELYKYGDVEQRLWLLRGLMDTDGSSSGRGSAEYCTISPQLAQDVAELARSLGCKVTITESKAGYRKDGIRKVTGTRFRLYIAQPEGLDIFNLERKKIKGFPEKYLRRTIIKIEKLETKVPMQCITIDHPDHLYLMDHYVPTHNCITGDSEIIDPETLKPVPIKYNSQINKTLVFDFSINHLVWASCKWILSGEKNCVRVCLGSGASCGLSTDHPVYSRAKGWIKVRDLKLGDLILAPKSIPVFGSLEPDDLEEILEEILSNFRVPDEVFLYSENSLKDLVCLLFNKVGTIFKRDKKIVLSLYHPNLTKDFQFLLLKLGIGSRIENSSSTLSIETELDYNLYCFLLGVLPELHDLPGPRRWERVIDLIPIGKKEVFDLEVDHPDHNFLTNNIIVHNSYALSILAIWHGLIKANQKIVIFAPSNNQVDVIFDNIDAWMYKNAIIESMKAAEGNHKSPQRRTFRNGSMIVGFPLGVAGGLEAGKRGITADVTLVDEAQEFSDEDWKVVGPIMRGDKFRMDHMKNYVTGTINRPQGHFYEKINKIASWSEETEAIIRIPITANKSYTKEQILQLKNETPEREWKTEWLLQADDLDVSVFRQSDLMLCASADWSYGPHLIDKSCSRFMGIDWDKTQAGSNIAILQYYPVDGIVKVIYREEVPRGDFTYTDAVKRVMDLYEEYAPDLVIADQGAGEVQWELLYLEGHKRKNGLTERLVKKAFNEKIETLSFETHELEKKRIKPFLVGQLQKKVQEQLFRFPKSDKALLDQFLQYQVKQRTETTIKFTSTNEHIIDCCLFGLWGIWYLYENYLTPEEKSRVRNLNVKEFSNPWDAEVLYDMALSERYDYPGMVIPRESLDIERSSFDFDSWRMD